MDISVLAAVGSFAVSERILKPKATVLVILGGILAYDLTTKTHDSASLRVYRGPALLAFSLALCAYSLRMWRRNGVACDELLFLPGTEHGQRHGVTESDCPVGASPSSSSQPPRMVGARSVDEGDAAAGGWTPTAAATAHQSNAEMEMTNTGPRGRTLSHESSISSIQEFANSWDEDDTEQNEEHAFFINDSAISSLAEDPPQAQSMPAPTSSSSHVTTTGQRPSTRAERFRENHPQITRIGSFFFFRSSTTSTQSAEYAPSGPSVVGAAMDLSMPILFNFHLYIEAYNHIDAYGSDFPAKILPLIFLSVLIFRSVFPPGRRMRFWGTMRYTLGTPWHKTRFRDCYVGDVLTSLVRPMQDVLFALSYYVTVVWGTLSGKYGLSESGEYLERSWILHNVVLPSAAILPLWWKFLQTLRQAYDTRRRWPYLGNAFKYLTASVVILYGMTHPEDRRSSWWLVSYGLATVYQVLWDTLVDWELFIIEPKQMQATDCDEAWFTSLSSYSPNSYCLSLLDNGLRPIRKAARMVVSRIPSYKQIKLRPQRLYKTEQFYYKIVAFNAFARFAWMLCFIPAYHLSPSGEEHITTFSSDTNSYVGVLLPVLEILRRAFWGFLFLENKTIRMQDGNPTYSRVSDTDGIEDGLPTNHHYNENDDDDEGNVPEGASDMSDNSKVRFPTWLGNPLGNNNSNNSSSSGGSHNPFVAMKRWFKMILAYDDDEEMRHRLYVGELTMWAVAFVVFGLWATT